MGGAGLGAQPGQQRGRASRRLCHRWSPLSVLPPSSSLAGGSSCVPLAALASPQPPGAAPYSPTRSSRQSPAVARAGARAGQPLAPKASGPGNLGSPKPARSDPGPSSGLRNPGPAFWGWLHWAAWIKVEANPSYGK